MEKSERMPQLTAPGYDVAAMLAEAVAYHRTGMLAEAENLYQRILNTSPDSFDPLHLLGVLHLQRGDYVEALRLFDRAIKINPNVADAHNNRGNALTKLKRFEAALASYDRAVALNPGDAAMFNNRGSALKELERFEEAVASYDCAIARKPDFAEALSNRGNALARLERFTEALADYDRAIALKPDHSEVFHNRGVALNKMNKFEEALDSYDRAIALQSDYAEALLNRGLVLQELMRFDEALASFDRAIAVSPDYAGAHWNRALLHLQVGRYVEGWRGYEWRRNVGGSIAREPGCPEWQGGDVTGQRVLLCAEQGLGDTIQFVRYAKLMAERGGRIILQVQPPLKSLLSGSPWVETVVAMDEPLPQFDVRCRLLSLPWKFGTTLETVPVSIPYLQAPPERVAAWRQRLPQKRPIVGLVWSGNPFYAKHRQKSLTFVQLAPLLAVPGVQFVSLHKDVSVEDASAVRDCSKMVDLRLDFVETAAAIMHLDLVIAVDTAVAHLTGALGRPVWVLLPYHADFRWLLDREDSPWYPSARLFRQSVRRDWGEVVERVAAELASAVSQSVFSSGVVG